MNKTFKQISVLKDGNQDPMLNDIKICCLVLRWVIAVACILNVSSCSIARADHAKPIAVSGLLDLSNHDLNQDGTIRLDGQWQFYWNTTPLPETFLKDGFPEPTGYYPVPKYWTAYRDLSLPPEGRATYRLLIRLNSKNFPLSLLTPEVFTEYRLFINGKLMDSHGNFSNGKIRFLSPRIFTFYNSRDTIEILLNIENHNHGNAGIGQSFFLGTPEQIRKQQLFSTVIEMILVAVCLFSGIYHMLLFSFRPREKDLLYFGIFCLFIALRTVSTGTTILTQIIPDLSFEAGSRFATAIIPLCVMAFQTYAFYFFRPIFPGKLHWALLLVHGLYLIMALMVSPMIYSTLFTPYFLVIAASSLLIIGVNIYAMVIGFRYSVICLAGLLFLFTGMVNDMLHYMQVINTGYFLSLWFSLFILAQSAMLAIKFANEHKMVETLSSKLQASDKLKDEFLANTSHELRTPLNGIIGISDSLIDGVTGDLPARTIDNLKLISSSGKRLSSLINDILDYSKLRNNDIAITKKNIDLRQMTEVVLTVVKATVPSRQIDMINAVSHRTSVVIGDEDRVQQILFNLIGNAVKFTEKGHVKVSAQDMGEHVAIHVEDTGPGIPEHSVDTIFRSFEQGDGTIFRGHGGTGLGLPITKKLVELQGGRISVRSIKGRGSIFSFTLKKGYDADLSDFEEIKFGPGGGAEGYITEENQHILGPALEHDNSTGEKLLIVDDEATNIRVLQNYLSLENYRSAYAANGIEAIEMVETGDYDLVLLDIMMPLMSGYEVCSRIRMKYTAYELPVIMLTAGRQNCDIVAAFQSGASDYLAKPIDRQELMVRIRTQLSLSRAITNAIHNANLANTDELTGLYNRRFMINSGTREFKNALDRKRPLSVTMIDIDLFKTINDSYGHAQGDRVLQHLAGIITSNIRGIDIAARYGGEEFVVIFPGTRGEGAVLAAEKIRQLVEKSKIPTPDNHTIQYTISLGVSWVHGTETCFEDLLQDADKLLYQSKDNGRNRVTCLHDQT